MRVQEASAERLVIAHDDTGWEKFGQYGVLFFAFLAVGAYINDRASRERWLGLAVCAACCLLWLLVFFERSSFEFDRATKKIRWRRRLSWRERSGVIDFYDVKAVVAQRPLGDDGVPSLRVVLITKEGEFPLRRAYLPDSGESDILVGRLKEFLGLPASDPVFERARQFAQAGNQMEAIRLLSEERKLSLSDARERVEMFRKGR